MLTFTVAEEVTLNLGDANEFSGYEILLKNLKSDKAVISVNGETNIFELNEEKVISGLKITLKEITYISDSEGSVKIDSSSLYVCGNSECDPTETQENCCQDCGCQTLYDCEENKCIVHVDNQCDDDADCEDNNPDTLDTCSGSPRKCNNISQLICDENTDCDDSNECTNDICRNNDCFNEVIPNCAPSAAEETQQEENDETENNDNEVQEINEQAPTKISFIKRIINFFKGLFS